MLRSVNVQELHESRVQLGVSGHVYTVVRSLNKRCGVWSDTANIVISGIVFQPLGSLTVQIMLNIISSGRSRTHTF